MVQKDRQDGGHNTETFKRGCQTPAHPVGDGKQSQPIDQVGAYGWTCVNPNGYAQVTWRSGAFNGKDW
nr:hypothetical protein [Sphingobacterium paucimobilis]